METSQIKELEAKKTNFVDLAVSERSLHTKTRDDLAATRLMLAAGKIFPECPYSNPRRAHRGEILARRRHDFIAILGLLCYLIFKPISKLVSHLFHFENTLSNPRIINKLV